MLHQMQFRPFVPGEARRELARGAGWEGRWEVSWRRGGTRAVRPRPLVKDEDLVLFAAAAEAALAAGWRYSVICGWRPHVMAALDMLSSQRRPLADPLRLAPQLLAAAGTGPLGFDDLTGATSCPAVARAHALHLIWHRRLGIDLAGPLAGQTMVWLADREPG
jgi:hypothetical protein